MTYDSCLVIKEYFKPFLVDLESSISSFNTTDDNNIDPIGLNVKLEIKGDDKGINKRHLNPVGKNNPANKREILSIIKYLQLKNKTITSSYYSWLRTAMAISNTFSYDLGEKYYLKLCRQDKDLHDEIRSQNLLINCYNTSQGVITFATIVYLAKEQGYTKSKRDSIEDG